MSIFTYISRVNKIKNDIHATAYFTPKEIVFYMVNLGAAKRTLQQDEYFFVSVVFETYRLMNKKLLLNQDGFIGLTNEIIAHFDLIAPYYKYCGNSSMRLECLLDGVKAEYRQKAKQLLQDNKIFSPEWNNLHDEFCSLFYKN